MGDDVDPSTIKKTQAILGKFVKRPVMSEKLLKRPPFRFLFDVICTVIKDTGYLEGLFKPADLKPEAYNEKETRIFFLQRVIEAVRMSTGEHLTITPGKILAGQEVAKTHKLLQCIGHALESKVSSDNAVMHVVKMVTGPYTAKKKAEPTKKSQYVGEKMSSKHYLADEYARKMVQAKVQTKRTEMSRTVASRQKDDAKDPPVRVASRQHIETPLSNLIKASAKIEAQASSKVSKHPYEYATNKSAPSKITDRPPKEELGATIPPPIRSKHEVRRKEIRSKVTPKGTPNVTPQRTPKVTPQASETEESENESVRVASAFSSRIKTVKEKGEPKFQVAPPAWAKKTILQHSQINQSGTTEKESFDAIIPAEDMADHDAAIHDPSFGLVLTEEFSNRFPHKRSPRRSVKRPPSARPAAPRLRKEIPIETIREEKGNPPLGFFASDNEDETDAEYLVQEAPNPPVEKKPSVSKLFKDVDDVDLSNGQHGHLVQQIVESQQKIEGKESKKKTEEDKGKIHGKDCPMKGYDCLRKKIQILAQNAYPLAKLMDFLNEDVDSMQAELKTWKDMNRECHYKIMEEKGKTETILVPMQRQLEQLDEAIEEERTKIRVAKLNIKKKDHRLKVMMTNVCRQSLSLSHYQSVPLKKTHNQLSLTQVSTCTEKFATTRKVTQEESMSKSRSFKPVLRKKPMTPSTDSSSSSQSGSAISVEDPYASSSDSSKPVRKSAQ